MNNALIQSSDNGHLAQGGGEPAGPSPNTAYRRYLLFLRRYWWLPLITVLLGLVCAAAYIHWAEPEFVASASMWETEKLLLPGGAAFSEDAQNYMGTQIELLRSPSLAQQTVSRMQTLNPKAVARDKNGNPPEVTVTVRQIPKSTIFQVDAASSNPAYSQAYLDTLLSVYLDYKKTVRKNVSGDTLASISEQVLRMESDLKSEQDALNAYERTNNLAVVQEEGKAAGAYLAKLQTELSDLRLESQLLDMADSSRARSAVTNSAAVTTVASDASTADSSSSSSSAAPAGGGQLSPGEEIALLKMQRDKLAKYLRPKHPKIAKLDSQIERDEKIVEMVRTRGREELATSRVANRQKTTNVLASVQEWQYKVTDANLRIAEAERLKQNVNRTQGVYDRLTQLLQNVDISRNIDQETLAILQPASQAKHSIAKETKALETATFCGLAIGLALVLLVMLRDDRFNSIVDVNAKFGDVVVGQVPDMPQLKGKAQPLLLALDDQRDAYAESYRNLRSAIFFMPHEGARPKILLVTSALPGEGKSTVVANLARSLAQGGSRVVLIDADLRKGYLHDLLGLRAAPGLGDFLEGSADFDDILQHDTLPNFFYVSRGKCAGNPGDLFLSPKLDTVFARLRNEFDYILIDTSPVFAADDAPTLAPKADGTLVVVRNGFSSASVVKEALELLGQRQVRVLGLVFNRADSSARSYYYYKHGDYGYNQKTA